MFLYHIVVVDNCLLVKRFAKLKRLGANFMKSDLFIPIVRRKNPSKHFDLLSSSHQHEPTRLMMDEVFQYFTDNDGNFIEQFQTTGFDQRVFELYLFAYFHYEDYTVIRDYDRPDFLIEKNGIRVAVEATTATETKNGKDETNNTELLGNNIEEKLLHELPIKLGSPLFSKLNKRYWELPHCKNTPLVIAIEDFHEEGSLQFTDSSLLQYLYGQKDEIVTDVNGKETLITSKISEHRVGTKVIPSGFFYQPNVENISAVLFSNSGTIAKFRRMGYQCGYYSHFMKIMRHGLRYNPDPKAFYPLEFAYDLDEQPYKESWGEGLVVCYNPNAKHPIPRDFFVDAAQHYIKDDKLYSDIPYFHPLMSETKVICYDEESILPCDITRITKAKFDKLLSNRRIPPFTLEYAWFYTERKDRLGLILANMNYKYNIMVYNNSQEGYGYGLSYCETNHESIEDAENALFKKMLN